MRQTAVKLGRLLRLKDASFDILLVGNRFMRKNVLSFPAPKRFPHPGGSGRYLGEVYLNPDYIKADPFFNGSRFAIRDKLAYMLIHGLLHLLGYDHKKKNDIIKMENMERKLLQKLVIGK